MFFFWACVCGCLLVACSDNSQPHDIVAKVNNHPITLSMLKARHDFDFTTISENRAPTQEELREQYAVSLTSLIISALIDQFLEENKMAVTNGEVEKEEKRIRADYSHGNFEKVLVEEYVDLEIWRSFLRQHLGRKKLNEKILRPNVKVKVEEVEEYYKKHPDEFNKAERVKLTVAYSLDRDALEQLRHEYLENEKNLSSRDKEGISVHTISSQLDYLPKKLHDMVKKMSPGEITSIFKINEKTPYPVYQFLVLEEIIPAEDKNLTEAYAHVERVLVEQKLEDVFGDWLTRETLKAKIEITDPLFKSVLMGAKELRRQSQESREKETAHELTEENDTSLAHF